MRRVYSVAFRPNYPSAPQVVASSELAFLLHHLLPLRFASFQAHHLHGSTLFAFEQLLNHEVQTLVRNTSTPVARPSAQ